jgi:hypothetical protein
MKFILIFVLVIAALGAMVAWNRRGQSNIGRESGDTMHTARRKAEDAGGGMARTMTCRLDQRAMNKAVQPAWPRPIRTSVRHRRGDS